MLKVEEVNTFYDEFHVLRDVSIDVNQAELVALLGPNGHGKSTLLKTICGLLIPSSGSIKYHDEEINSSTSERLVEMGLVYIAEDRHLFPDMTVLENLKLGAYNRSAREKEDENLEYVLEMFPKLKILLKRYASNLSGGEARMLAIGRGLMSNAKLLAIDEPSLGLAPNLRLEVLNKIAEVNKSGITILLVEQSTPQLSEMADRFYLMEEGQITFAGNQQDALCNERLKEAFLGCV
jgi:branched-chain amino acid transport system ATP-binding protein